MLKCSIFLPFSLEIKTESNTHFSGKCHKKCHNQFKSDEQAQRKKEMNRFGSFKKNGYL